MPLSFNKYHGTGNDFILIDNRNEEVVLSTEQIKFMCDRHMGIGADGLMLLQLADGYDFKMVYYNSDGRESTMCGNGGRCITAFAKKLGIIEDKARFIAIDGEHESFFTDDLISLHMKNVEGIFSAETFFELNTGSPHYVHFTDYVNELDVKKEGALIRYSPRYKDEGINVNFVEKINEHEIFVRTYERGVENETLSCGTGVTACSLVLKQKNTGLQTVKVHTPGGELQVTMNNLGENKFQDIWLTGKAIHVFSGQIDL